MILQSLSSGCCWRGMCEFTCCCCARLFAREMVFARHVNSVIWTGCVEMNFYGISNQPYSFCGVCCLINIYEILDFFCKYN